MANVHSDSLSVGPEHVSQTGVSASPAMSKIRKRTKTGCLTCRKRRIKCGEERPTCGNCIKSKRQCEGYNQRVIFKPPMGDWPNHPSVVSTIQYHTSMLPGARSQRSRAPEQLAPTQYSPHIETQPRSSIGFDFSSGDRLPGAPNQMGQQGQAGDRDGFGQSSIYQQTPHPPLYRQSFLSPHQPPQFSTSSTSQFPEPSSTHLSASPQRTHGSRGAYQDSQPYNHNVTYPPVSVPYDSNVEMKSVFASSFPPSQIQRHTFDNQPDATDLCHPQSSPSPHSDRFAQYTEPQPVGQPLNVRSQGSIRLLRFDATEPSHFGHYNHPTDASHADFRHPNSPHVQLPTHESTSNVNYMPQPVLGMSYL